MFATNTLESSKVTNLSQAKARIKNSDTEEVRLNLMCEVSISIKDKNLPWNSMIGDHQAGKEHTVSRDR